MRGLLVVVVGTLLSVPLSGSVALAGDTASADTLEEAKHLFMKGESEYSLSHFDVALQAYSKSFEMTLKPNILFNIAQCYRKLDRHAEAAHAYRRYVEQKPDAANRPEVEKYIAMEDEAMRASETAKAASLAAPPPETTHEQKPVPPPLALVPVAPVEEPTPTYKKWYVWTIVAGVVVVGAGVGLGVGLGTASHDTALDSHALTTLELN